MGNRLLVAIDESKSWSTTVDYTTGLARRDGASVHVVFANPRLLGGRGLTALSAREAVALVSGAMAVFSAAGIDVSGSVARTGVFDVAQAIVDTAAEKACSAIVVGSHRRRHLNRLIGHGVRERIISLSPLPVITAPAPLRIPAGRLDAVKEFSSLQRTSPSVVR